MPGSLRMPAAAARASSTATPRRPRRRQQPVNVPERHENAHGLRSIASFTSVPGHDSDAAATSPNIEGSLQRGNMLLPVYFADRREEMPCGGLPCSCVCCWPAVGDRPARRWWSTRPWIRSSRRRFSSSLPPRPASPYCRSSTSNRPRPWGWPRRSWPRTAARAAMSSGTTKFCTRCG